MSAITLATGMPPDGMPARDEVQVRLLHLAPSMDAERTLRRFLSHDEIERASRYQFDFDRSRFALTRGWLRVILAGALATRPERLVFSYGLRGKPSLAGAHEGAGLSFNVSHSGGYAVIAVTAGRAVGVDIEQRREMTDFANIATSFFSETERGAIFKFSEADRLAAFFRCWTRKEAFMKATGEGMAIALDGFAVDVDRESESVIPAPDGAGGRRDYTVTGLSLVPECEAAVAVEGTGMRISAWLDRV